MKKQILSFLFVLGLGLFMTSNALAVNEGDATVGATKTYTVTATVGTSLTATAYEWEVNPSAGWTGTSVTNSIDITWTAANTYTVRVRVKDSNGCYSDWQTKSVTVYATDYTIAAITNQQTCSLINLTGNGNASGINNNADNTEFNVTLSNVPSGATYTIVYNVGGSTPVTISNYTSSSTITVTHVAYDALFTNTGATAVNRTITVTSVKRTGETVEVPLKAATGITSYNVSVLPKPTITAM